MFEKNVPLPSPTSQWDFSVAEIGDSLPFADKARAMKFAAAVRVHARRKKNGWGTKMAPDKKGYRVWIVGRTAAAAPIKRETNSLPPTTISTETDDDLSLRVDLRNGDVVSFHRAPEQQPVEGIEPEPEDGHPKRRKRTHAIPVAPNLNALLPQAAE